MVRFLFQGDSITDAGRDRNDDNNYGYGYANLMASELLRKFPGEYEFLNRGISGNRVVDLYARMKSDIVNLRPDFVSILIGVNDVWHELSSRNGVSAPRYEVVYSMLVEDLLEKLPDLKIIILEPFVLKGTATEESYGYFREEVEKRAEAAKNVAEKYGLVFIPLQEKFDKVVADGVRARYWLSDGVHPTAAGHQIIKEALMQTFTSLQD